MKYTREILRILRKAAKEGNHFIFNYKGLVCVIVRNHSRFGHTINWCGYVKIPRHHKLYGLSSEAPTASKISIHGGITFAGEPYWWNDKTAWFLGFDFAHSGDVWHTDTGESNWRSYKDRKYAIRETIDLAKQIAAIDNRHKDNLKNERHNFNTVIIDELHNEYDQWRKDIDEITNQ